MFMNTKKILSLIIFIFTSSLVFSQGLRNESANIIISGTANIAQAT